MNAPWQYVVGMLPHKVVAYEDTARKGVIYLRWRVAGEWVRRSLGFTLKRDTKGRVLKDDERRAQKAADEQYSRLITGTALPKSSLVLLTLAEGWTLACDAERGKWNTKTPHRDEIERYMARAKSILGASTAWNAIGRGDIRRLWRAELKRARALGKTGVRSAELIVSRFFTVAAWLRDEQAIASDACLPWRAMRAEFAKDAGTYAPKRLRYSLEQYRAMLANAHQVDERWHLLLDIGAEYRLGQVVRVKRSHVDTERGGVRIVGAGNKRGTVIQLTAAQLEHVRQALQSGYLAGLERARVAGDVADFAIFPGGHLPRAFGALTTTAAHATRKPLDSTVLRAWLRENERVCDIAHQRGRGWYGLRRAAVDAAKAAGISREGLQQSGGWTDAQVPDRIYADQEQDYARTEAAKVRAAIRGETPQEIPQETDQNGASPANGGEARETRNGGN